MSDVLRRRRLELRLSQAQLAAAAGVDTRQIRRYEAGQQQPLLSVAVAIADALGISVGELAGIPTHGVNLGGHWWTVWQSCHGGTEVLTAQPVQMRQERDRIEIEALDRGPAVAEGGGGGYLWRGELRVWDNEVMMGWYAAIDGAIRSKGTLYLVLPPQGQRLSGRWVGLRHDAMVASGWTTVAKSEVEARELMDRLKGAGVAGASKIP